ncbi:MAG TPA: cyclic nucleotide-binding domain-containing protein [Acidimicrobiia bacterium]|nr:cyclic nucleotide-binding domain-containing protein [Acidimicrobiia bacterium]
MHISRLGSINVLRNLDPEILDFLDDRLQEVTVPVGGHMVKAGDHAYRFFVILEGSAVVSREGMVITSLGAGDVFGEMALLEDLHRNADVVAVTPMKLGAIMAWDFREAVDRFPDFERTIDQVIRDRSPGG